MIKNIFRILIILISIKGISQKNISFSEQKINQIFLLETTEKINIFFEEIKKHKKDQAFSDNANSDLIFVEITQSILIDFIKSIDKIKFIADKEFSKEYEFNISPNEYISNISCSDLVSLSYLEKENQFLLTVVNSFYIEDFGCTESGLTYLFKIENGKIIFIHIMEIG